MIQYIYPIHERMVQRAEKEKFLQQCARVFWLTGLSGSGKSTLALAVERRLHERGILTQILDGDNIRAGLNQGLSFSDDDRRENIRRVAEVAKLFVNSGVVTFVTFISPARSERAMAKTIIGDADFFEIHVSADYNACEKRDTKGLYAKARGGEIKQFVGLQIPYEPPLKPALVVPTAEIPMQQAAESLFNFCWRKIVS